MADELKQIIDGSFDVVPAVQALALRLHQLELDVAKLAVAEPDFGKLSPSNDLTAVKRSSNKKAAA